MAGGDHDPSTPIWKVQRHGSAVYVDDVQKTGKKAKAWKFRTVESFSSLRRHIVEITLARFLFKHQNMYAAISRRSGLVLIIVCRYPWLDSEACTKKKAPIIAGWSLGLHLDRVDSRPDRGIIIIITEYSTTNPSPVVCVVYVCVEQIESKNTRLGNGIFIYRPCGTYSLVLKMMPRPVREAVSTLQMSTCDRGSGNG